MLGVNLDQDIIIKPKSAIVYPDDIYQSEKQKPAVGHKLNKRCLITLNNIEKPEDQTVSKFERALRQKCDTMKLTFISYD